MAFDLTTEEKINIESFYKIKKQNYNEVANKINCLNAKIKEKGAPNCSVNVFLNLAGLEQTHKDALEEKNNAYLLKNLLFNMKKNLKEAKGKLSIFKAKNYNKLKKYAKLFHENILNEFIDSETNKVNNNCLELLLVINYFVKNIDFHFPKSINFNTELSCKNYELIKEYSSIQDVLFDALDADMPYEDFLFRSYLFQLFKYIKEYDQDTTKEEDALKNNDVDAVINIALNKVHLEEKMELNKREKTYLKEVPNYLNCYSRKDLLFAKNELYSKGLNYNSTLHNQEEEERINQAIITLARHQKNKNMFNL